MADRLIGKTGSEEAKWDFTDAFQKSWIPKLRLWHGYIYIQKHPNRFSYQWYRISARIAIR